jgi:hypothetical protein
MSKTARAILIGIIIFIAAGSLSVYWLGKRQRDKEERRMRQVWMQTEPIEKGPSLAA